MKLGCLLGWHPAPHPYFARNNGTLWAGECYYCQRLIVKIGKGRWRSVPRGYKLEWQSRSQKSARSPHLKELPVLTKL